MNEEERKVLSLRFVVVGLVFFGLTGIEGIIMRFRLANSLTDVLDPQHYYAMMTAHPFVGIYGWAYMTVMGAFYFLVPYVMGRDIYSKKAAGASFVLMILGVAIVWTTTFITHYAPLYTLYWPLPVAADIAQWDPLSIVTFSLGGLMIVASVLTFFFNMFATIFLPSNPEGRRGLGARYVARNLVFTAFNLDKLRAKIRGTPDYVERAFQLPVFSVAVFRGCIDTTVSASIFGVFGVLMLVYGVGTVLPEVNLASNLVDPLIYKNIFWWGLDMIADGNVLIFTAGVWYLLVPLLLKRPLYGESVVRTVILADLVVSFFVWNHHLLADTPQPLTLQIMGQLVTWGELVTMGLTMFAILMTLWQSRPVAYSTPLKFIMASILGYGIGGIAGVLQANYALNAYLHNTQWVIGIHAHTQLLVGLSLTLFAAIYALFPMLTGKQLSDRLANLHLILMASGGLVMGVSLGLAGVEGMLRRTLYPDGLGGFLTYLDFATLGAMVMAAGFAFFLLNLFKTVGLRGLVRLFLPIRGSPE